MNQDFTVQKKKQYLSEKKKIVQRGSPEKKIPAQGVSENKNSCKLKIPHPPPPPPITFLMVRPLEKTVYSTTHKTTLNRPMDHTGKT